MDEKQNELGDAVTIETVGFSVPLERIKEIHHTESLATPEQQNLKLSPFSVEDVIDHSSFMAVHWQNTPLVNGLMFVKNQYWTMLAVIDEYQLKHQDAFFEQYRTLIIQSSSEDWLSKGTSYLRMHYRELASRLAHYYLHYYNACCMWVGAASNACIFANINGEGKFADFGRALKISSLRTPNVRFPFFPKPVDMVRYFLEFSKFSVGSTNYGATFVSAPYWITDVFGCRGQRCASFSDIAAAWDPTGDAVAQWNLDAADYDMLMDLYSNCLKVQVMYGSDVSHGADLHHKSYVSNVLDPENKATALPTTAKVENGAQLVFKFDSTGVPGANASAVTSFSENNNAAGIVTGNETVILGDGTRIKTDNIINRIWDSLMFWQEYVEVYFHEMSQPTSAKYVFAHDTLKLVEAYDSTMDFSTFFNNINTNYTFDARSLRDAMVYKRDNVVNKATWIKWAPILDGQDHDYLNDGANFDSNFDRYPMYEEDTQVILSKAKVWPDLSPLVSHQNIINPDSNTSVPVFIANATSAPGYYLDSDHELQVPQRAILGKEATILDLACSAGVANDYNLVETATLNPDDAKVFLDSCDAIVFKEMPDTLHALYQPLIDCTDIYQCGFNIMLSYDVRTKSEVEKWFMDENYAASEDDTITVADGYLLPNGMSMTNQTQTIEVSAPAFKASAGGTQFGSGNNLFFRSHVACKEYINTVKHALVFIGDNIWFHPTQWSSRLQAGLPAEVYKLNGLDSAFDDFLTAVRTYATLLPDNPASDETPWATALEPAVLYSIGLAACTHDPAILPDVPGRPVPGSSPEVLKKLASEFTTFKRILVNYFDKTKNCEVYNFLFNPEYGPVCPVTYNVPDIGFIPVLGVEKYGNPSEPDAATALKLCTSTKMVGDFLGSNSAVYEYAPDAVKTRFIWDSYITPASFYLWFITRISFKRLILRGHSFRLPSDVTKSAAYAGRSKAMYMALSRGRVEYTGGEDTKSFYGKGASLREIRNPVFNHMKSVDYGKLITPPKVRINKKSTNFINPAQASGSFTTRFEEATGSDGDSTSHSQSNNNNNGGKHGKGKGKGKGKPKWNKSKTNNFRSGEREAGNKPETQIPTDEQNGKTMGQEIKSTQPQTFVNAKDKGVDDNPNAPMSINNS